MRNIKELTLGELEEMFKDWGAPAYLAKEVLVWVYQKNCAGFSQMSNLSLGLRQRLEDNFCISKPECVKSIKSQDGTEKFLLRLKDDNLIEAVAIPAEGRVTGCVSSQVGCRFACKFCASGLRGFKRHLSAPEIIDQVLLIKERAPGGLTHLVFMGTGEPLDNYDNLMPAVRMINAPFGLGIGARRITISTCGIIPGIERLSQEKLQVELSISLHAADDALRSQLVPINKKYPLAALSAACLEYTRKTKRQITFEYVLMRAVNSDLPSARKLSTMLKRIPLAKVNLIPANAIPELNIEPPGKLEILLFQDHLKKAGINVTLRKPRGVDIQAACGQLRLGHERQS